MEPVLSIEDVSFHYGPIKALEKINLDVHAGEILSILGPNGSGKSTLLKVMDGLVVPQEGNVRVMGRPIGRLGRTHLARNVAMVAQENYFRFSFSTIEVVLMGRHPHLKRLSFEGKKDLEVAWDALKMTHAAALAHRSIHELSGGEKQRVLIARALAQEPRIILLDEPTSFLDLKFKREIFQLISSLSRDRGLAVVVVSHDLDLTVQYCHRVVLLKDGAVYAMGETDQVITAANIEAVYDCPVLVDKNPVTGRPRVCLT